MHAQTAALPVLLKSCAIIAANFLSTYCVSNTVLFIGSPTALPSALTRTLRLRNIPFSNITATPIYAVQSTQDVAWDAPSEALNQLIGLLNAKPQMSPIPPSSTSAWVLPRPGTTSPWASKAMDIFGNTGCQLVKSIASGTLWQGSHFNAEWCFDAMTQVLYTEQPNLYDYFAPHPATPLASIALPSLPDYARLNGLALSKDELALLDRHYQSVGRDPTDAEIMMFAQANSEHCRHKIFNALWMLDGQPSETSLFALIRSTTAAAPNQVLSAYSDNAAVMQGAQVKRLMPDAQHLYHQHTQTLHTCLKAETHNHPTAIAPFEGAATGVGGEIRDEAATGLGGMPKAGWCGFITANLRLPNLPMPWEHPTELPSHASALSIMIEGPLGGANYGNEFGRPTLMGFFRTLETQLAHTRYAYYKPVMLAGGIASIDQSRVTKNGFPAGTKLVVLGGPSFRIGLGGGSSSSLTQGSNNAGIDFASVQRDNPEMQRRCQMVIDACCGEANNPIASIHDIGAGGLANAFPELVHDCRLGATINLDAAPCDDASLSPMEIWCNESQERYALAITEDHLPHFDALCQRERCPYAVIGEATAEPHLVVTHRGTTVVNLPMDVLFGSLPQLRLEATTDPSVPASVNDQLTNYLPLPLALVRVLACPSVASKEFLITIADRSISGMVAGESMIGPWQTPVGDCGLTLDSPQSISGQAIALGERTPVAISNTAAASRMAIAEAITNLAACGSLTLDKVILSANWMAAPGTATANAQLHQAVDAAAAFCRDLGIAVPVGKDSLSMRSLYGKNAEKEACAPVSLIASALTQVNDVRHRLTPQLQPEGSIWLIEPRDNPYALGNSALAQICDHFGGQSPDVGAPALQQLVHCIGTIRPLIHAYHDRSDGGLWACLCEMAFAARLGITIDCRDEPALEFLLNEAIGVCVQIIPKHEAAFAQLVSGYTNLRAIEVAKVHPKRVVEVHQAQHETIGFDLSNLLQQWYAVSDSVTQLRDHPQSVASARSTTARMDTHLNEHAPTTLLPPATRTTKPRVAVLREQGSNGHRDLSYAFHAAGFDVIDLSMQDLRDGMDMSSFQGLAACGGFSYGDVLGGGTGWAASIIHNQQLLDQLLTFWQRSDTFTLGICNGCQMLSQLGDYIPEGKHFRPILANSSDKFEGRLVQVRITASPSVLLQDMHNARLVVPIAHSYGRFTPMPEALSCAVYCNHTGARASHYPANPNGSTDATAGVCSGDGRVTLLMPHPERRFLRHQCPWDHPQNPVWDDHYSPWFRMFQNAYAFVC